MTFLGAPMIWYGDEAGMFGAGDPIDRKQMLWKDLEPYDNPDDTVMPDLMDHYRRVIAIRNTYPALQTGQFHTWVTDDANDIYGFSRTRGEEVVAVVMNNSDRDQTVTLPSPFPDGSKVVDVMNATSVDFAMVPMESLSFPNFVKGASVRTIQIGPKTEPVQFVRDKKIALVLSKKSAAILVRE
jgi:hypothetical protein